MLQSAQGHRSAYSVHIVIVFARIHSRHVRSGKIPQAQQDGVVALPYRKGDMSMVIHVPESGTTKAEQERSLASLEGGAGRKCWIDLRTDISSEYTHV